MAIKGEVRGGKVVQAGKGSGRRKENLQKFKGNYDHIEFTPPPQRGYKVRINGVEQ